MNKSKRIWDYYGDTDPYYAVVTLDKYRNDSLSAERRSEFFKDGEEHIEKLWREIVTDFIPDFSPEYSLDFGCGVGRLLIPLAARSGHAFGVDISSSMLKEAQQNCAERGIENVTLVDTEDFLRGSQQFDFVHSYIVLQHIDPVDGMFVAKTMLERLRPGGIGALHLTYSHVDGTRASIWNRLYYASPLIFKIRNLVMNSRAEPLIPMHMYDLNNVFKMLHENECGKLKVFLTDHSVLGAFMICQKGIKSPFL